MSTRSNIGILNSDGTVRAVYIHFDGYPTGVGAGLLKDFKTPEAINARLDKGNGSTLDDGFYKDQGEDEQDATVFKSKDEYLTEHVCGWVEYQYLYEDGKWNAYKVPSDEGKSVLMGDLKRVVRKGWYDEMNKA
jgi:hypothetical protein